ncbi:MarR family transcriptional regulator [Devosia sp. BK]|uniref:MarR family winged helix-turn-helix transcriptional regulator n=1 Tax=Devosia sp. BK TaxID=2871706 RepID=UPI00293B1343|nr:MarR family transcriptional regulator [Devosia sp. BK]MDV3250500.1 MarR family transcriptional regulator [Devosia sp. BK]
MAARTVTRLADRRLRPFGVTAAQFNIMGMLVSRPNRSISEMASELAMERTTLSRNLALLERKGLIATEATAEGKARPFALTETGRAAFDKAVPEWRRSIADLRLALRDPNYETVINGLRTIARL